MDHSRQPVGRSMRRRSLARLLAGQHRDSARLGTVPDVAADVTARALLALASGLCQIAPGPALDIPGRASPAERTANSHAHYGFYPAECPSSHVAPTATTYNRNEQPGHYHCHNAVPDPSERADDIMAAWRH